ncbi:MAG: hypothetical protein ACOX6I_02110 [Syntrophomonadaceae bacterium]|jgi:hypothetical protein
MSKLVTMPLQVYQDRKGNPEKIISKERLIKITQIMECWHDTGCWWEGESEKVFYRIACQDGSVWEIFNNLFSGKWFLYKVYD